MKACVLHAVGDLRCEEAPDPKPGAGEALIAIKACGVCGSDIPRVFEKGTYRFPTIPGHEMAGEVVSVGEGCDPNLAGKAVAVFPLIPCRRCEACETGAYAQCADYNYLGSRCDGGFAEYVVAPAWNLQAVPEGVSYEAAAMCEPAAVAAHALRRVGLDLGDSVAIFGAGPIGIMLGMWARIWGANRVLLADIDDAKLEFTRDVWGRLSSLPSGPGRLDSLPHGASSVLSLFNPRSGDAIAWIKDETGRGADVVIEASGSSAAFEQSVLSARTFGRVVLMGNPAGEMRLSQKAYWAVLRNELKVLGTWNSTYSGLPRNEWRLSLDAMASGALNVEPLVTHRVSLDELPEAMAAMRDRKMVMSKLMMVNRSDGSDG